MTNQSQSEKSDRAKRYLYYILAKKDYSESEINRKLKQNHPECNFEELIQYFKDHNFINDERFVENFIRIKHRENYGESYIKNKLFQKGLSHNDLNHIFMEYDFFEACRLQKEKIFDERKSDDFKYINKIKRRLLSRGFSYEQINNCF